MFRGDSKLTTGAKISITVTVVHFENIRGAGPSLVVLQKVSPLNEGERYSNHIKSYNNN